MEEGANDRSPNHASHALHENLHSNHAIDRHVNLFVYADAALEPEGPDDRYR